MNYSEILAIIESDSELALKAFRDYLEKLSKTRNRLMKLYLTMGYSPYLSVKEVEELSLTNEDLNILVNLHNTLMKEIVDSLYEDEMSDNEFYDKIKKSDELTLLYDANKKLYKIAKRNNMRFNEISFMMGLSSSLNKGDLGDYRRK